MSENGTTWIRASRKALVLLGADRHAECGSNSKHMVLLYTINTLGSLFKCVTSYKKQNCISGIPQHKLVFLTGRTDVGIGEISQKIVNTSNFTDFTRKNMNLIFGEKILPHSPPVNTDSFVVDCTFADLLICINIDASDSEWKQFIDKCRDCHILYIDCTNVHIKNNRQKSTPIAPILDNLETYCIRMKPERKLNWTRILVTAVISAIIVMFILHVLS